MEAKRRSWRWPGQRGTVHALAAIAGLVATPMEQPRGLPVLGRRSQRTRWVLTARHGRTYDDEADGIFSGRGIRSVSRWRAATALPAMGAGALRLMGVAGRRAAPREDPRRHRREVRRPGAARAAMGVALATVGRSRARVGAEAGPTGQAEGGGVGGTHAGGGAGAADGSAGAGAGGQLSTSGGSDGGGGQAGSTAAGNGYDGERATTVSFDCGLEIPSRRRHRRAGRRPSTIPRGPPSTCPTTGASRCLRPELARGRGWRLPRWRRRVVPQDLHPARRRAPGRGSSSSSTAPTWTAPCT